MKTFDFVIIGAIAFIGASGYVSYHPNDFLNPPEPIRHADEDIKDVLYKDPKVLDATITKDRDVDVMVAPQTTPQDHYAASLCQLTRPYGVRSVRVVDIQVTHSQGPDWAILGSSQCQEKP